MSLPRHIAIIMDGNGRFAAARGLPRSAGHAKGAAAVIPIVEACVLRGVEALTLYSFSTENWAREQAEVDFLMDLCVEFLTAQAPLLVKHNLRFRHLGRREGLPAHVLSALDDTAALTEQHTGMHFCLAINYGGRAELADAAKFIAEQVAAGIIAPHQVNEGLFAAHLDTAGLPDPDLLIRTAGEKRISNFLPWQAAYAEFVIDEVCWPEFTPERLDLAIAEFGRRTRKFGGAKA